jgi:hypothetical protein
MLIDGLAATQCVDSSGETVKSRACPRCVDVSGKKPASDFYKNRSIRDGLSSYCKSCYKKDFQELAGSVGTIYGLLDPRDDRLRYIGKTVVSLEKRLREHVSFASSGVISHRCCWIRSLGKVGLRPTIVPIVSIDVGLSGTALADEERRLIALHKAMGADLTNGTDGGEGAEGYRHGPEARRKISEAQKGKKRPHAGLSRRALTSQQEEEVCVAYAQNLSCEAIGKRFGLSGGGIQKILVRHGIKRRLAAVGRWLTERARNGA